MPIQIRRSVGPPYGATLAERDFDTVDGFPGFPLGIAICVAAGRGDGVARAHKIGNERLPVVFGERWVRGSPKATPDYKVATVGRNWMIGMSACHQVGSTG